MSTAKSLIALLRSHAAGDDPEFYATAMEIAAGEARRGHQRVAVQIRDLVDQAKVSGAMRPGRNGAILAMRERQDLAGLVAVATPDLRLSAMVLPPPLRNKLDRVLQENRQSRRLRERGLHPRRKLLLIGPPGTGKTMTASALAGELHLPLLTTVLEGILTKFMGESASKLRAVFEAMHDTPGVYLFDEFDAIGARRSQPNDVGEIRRVLNSFLQLLECDRSTGPIIAATNHPDLLDPALFRRFDDVLQYELPTPDQIIALMESRLAPFGADALDLPELASAGSGLSQAEVTRACEEAAKLAVMSGRDTVSQFMVLEALKERRGVFRPNTST